ncbi:MAG: ABC transporter substrate-binding protein [Nitriliruptorales bacterium]
MSTQLSARRHLRLLALVAALMLALVACGDGGDGAAEPAADETDEAPATETEEEPAEASGEPIRIGMLTSLTGPFTPWGVQVQAGMHLAAEEINAAGGVDGRPIEIVEADDANNPEEGIAAVERMVEQDGVVAIGGIISSDVGLATSRTAEELGVPIFMVKAGAGTILSRDSRFTFRTCLPAAPMVAQPVAQYIQAQGQTKVGAIIADYAWGQAVREALEDSIGALEGVEMQIEVAPVPEQDFTQYLRRLESFGPDVIVATGHPPGSGPITVQATDQGLDVPITGAWSPLATVVGGVGEVAYDRYADFGCADYDSDSYQDLAMRFLASSDLPFMEDDAVAAHGIVTMVAEAVGAAGDDREAVAQYLHDNSFDLPGYAHTVSWTEWGELAEARPTFVIIREMTPPEGVSEAGNWYPELLIHAEPLEPFEP